MWSTAAAKGGMEAERCISAAAQVVGEVCLQALDHAEQHKAEVATRAFQQLLHACMHACLVLN